jgi:hypothetical protein
MKFSEGGTTGKTEKFSALRRRARWFEGGLLKVGHLPHFAIRIFQLAICNCPRRRIENYKLQSAD